jgi:hypothetical protein
MLKIYRLLFFVNLVIFLYSNKNNPCITLFSCYTRARSA